MRALPRLAFTTEVVPAVPDLYVQSIHACGFQQRVNEPSSVRAFNCDPDVAQRLEDGRCSGCNYGYEGKSRLNRWRWIERVENGGVSGSRPLRPRPF